MSMGQAFERERMSRCIETTNDVKQLQKIAVTLLDAWLTQRAATGWVMREALGSAPKIDASQFELTPQEEING